MRKCEVKQAFVLCAGNGTRLYPLTKIIPKCLVKVKGISVLTYIHEHLSKFGINNLICNIGSLKEELQLYVKENNRNIHLSHETTPLGTAGGILNALELMDDDFIVYYGDVVTNVDINRLLHLYEEKQADAALFIHQSNEPSTGGLVEFDESFKVKNIIEKPTSVESHNFINSGILIIKKSSIQKYKKEDYFDLAGNLLPQMLKDNKKIYALPINDGEYVFDMGTFERLEKTTKYFSL